MKQLYQLTSFLSWRSPKCYFVLDQSDISFNVGLICRRRLWFTYRRRPVHLQGLHDQRNGEYSGMGDLRTRQAIRWGEEKYWLHFVKESSSFVILINYWLRRARAESFTLHSVGRNNKKKLAKTYMLRILAYLLLGSFTKTGQTEMLPPNTPISINIISLCTILDKLHIP